MMARNKILIPTLFAMLAATLPLPPAAASHACVVGPGSEVCVTWCPAPAVMTAAVTFGGDAGATITFICDPVARCEAPPLGACVAGNATLVAGPGFCILEDHGGLPDATGFCDTTHNIELCIHSSPHSHTYGSGGSTGARSDSASAGRTAGVTTVSDTNTNDCDGDGLKGDFDGDYDTGVGGAFFGHGPWANEPICQYGLATHGATITVSDLVFGNDVQFVIGADDTSGPAISTDPVTGETTCETDGRITPGDPNTDPTRDADDCLTPVIDGGSTNGQGTTCGAGGDGGYWVFLIGARVHEAGTGVTVNNPATSGTITA